MPGYVEKSGRLYLSTGHGFPCTIIRSVALIKWAMAEANHARGRLPGDIANAIKSAALQVASTCKGVTVDVYQTGSGTGLNMNVNDLVAEKASEILGRRVHPNDHVNMGQSSNDVIPTAVRIAAALEARDVQAALAGLSRILRERAIHHVSTVKPGRTHLRDALPVTLGLWFSSYASAFGDVEWMLGRAVERVVEVPLGGTAVGTGVGTTRDIAEHAVRLLADRTGLPLRPARPRSKAMRLILDLQLLSSTYKIAAALLWRMAQDIRLMYSGPVNGLNDIDLEICLPGSSMMPGKTNPVTSESIMQAASRIIGLDGVVTQAALLGELELGMGWPLTAYTLSEMANLLMEALRKAGEEAGRVKLREEAGHRAYRSPAMATLLSPFLGYDKAAQAAEELLSGASLEEVSRKYGLDPERIREEALGWEHY